jgi:hypothetical protein
LRGAVERAGVDREHVGVLADDRIHGEEFLAHAGLHGLGDGGELLAHAALGRGAEPVVAVHGLGAVVRGDRAPVA